MKEPIREIVSRTMGLNKTDPEQHIVYGVVYAPGNPDQRDTQGQWMSAEEVVKMARRFMANLRLHQIDKQHDWEPDEGMVVESFIAREGDSSFPAGAWVLGVKILKDETWEAIKNGEITSYSIAGLAEIVPDEGGQIGQTHAGRTEERRCAMREFGKSRRE